MFRCHAAWATGKKRVSFCSGVDWLSEDGTTMKPAASSERNYFSLQDMQRENAYSIFGISAVM